MSFEMQAVTDGQKKILLALSFVIILVLIHLFVVEPMKEKTSSALAQATELNAETGRRIRMVKKIIPMREEIASLQLSVLPMTNRFVLRKELGSYPVQRKLYEVASENLKIAWFSERGRVRLVDPVFANVRSSSQRGRSNANAQPPVPCYDRYQAEVKLQGGYRAVMEFLRTLEKENPFFSVVSLEIKGNDARPEVHGVLMTVEWPVDAPRPSPEGQGKR